MRDREAEDPSVVICVGKKCCAKVESRAVVEAARAYTTEAHPRVHVEVVSCLHVCKKGPIAATFPSLKFKKRVNEKRVRKMIDKLDR
ncbi:MAG: (2Fe-2S) ferredoxin domain-containing protein [Kofleriaceae bacterium]|nr:(2Fe-2S) ferredoxin domain-containing protein [Kofleriaceae bacterium]